MTSGELWRPLGEEQTRSSENAMHPTLGMVKWTLLKQCGPKSMNIVNREHSQRVVAAGGIEIFRPKACVQRQVEEAREFEDRPLRVLPEIVKESKSVGGSGSCPDLASGSVINIDLTQSALVHPQAAVPGRRLLLRETPATPMNISLPGAITGADRIKRCRMS